MTVLVDPPRNVVKAILSLTAPFAIAVAVLTSAGCSRERHDQSQLVDRAASHGRRAAVPRQLGATELPAVLLRKLASRVDAIVGTAIGRVPASRLTPEEPGEPLPEAMERVTDDYIAYITVAAPSRGPAAQRPVWEALLVAGALRDALDRVGEEPLYDVVIDLRLPDGGVVANAGGGLGVAERQPPSPHASPQAVADEIRARASALELSVKSIEFAGVERTAPAVTAETAMDPRDVVKRFYGRALAAVFGPWLAYEGVHLRIDDGGGEPILVSGAASRAAVGMVWVRPELDHRLRPKTSSTHS